LQAEKRRAIWEGAYSWGDFWKDTDDIVNRGKSAIGGENVEEWRALTKIRLRSGPSIDADTVEDGDGYAKTLLAGERFLVAEVRSACDASDAIAEKRRFLRIAGTDTWVFDLGTAGNWLGKAVVEKAPSEATEPKQVWKKIFNPFDFKGEGGLDDML